MKVSAKDLHRIIREELQIIEAHDDPFNIDPVRYPHRDEVDPEKKYAALRHAPRTPEQRGGNERDPEEAATVAYMNRLGVQALGHFKDDIEKWIADHDDIGAMLPGDDRYNATVYMGNLDYANMAPLYKAAVAAAKAREEQEMTRRGRREGVDLWNRIVGPRGDANSGTGYTLKEGPGSDDYTDPSDIVSRGWRERADEKLRQDAAALKKHIASLGSDEELPHPFASSGEEDEDETYGLHRGYGSRRTR